MRIKVGVSALLAMALLTAGCGGDMTPEGGSDAQSREAMRRPYSYDVVYYSGPDFTTVVGTTAYGCSGIWYYGTVTAYSRIENELPCYECPINTLPPFCEDPGGI